MIRKISLLLVAIFLTSIWFHKGLALGGGEAGLPFYHLSNELNIVSHSWVEKALGNQTGIVTALSLYFSFFSFFQSIGVPAAVLQAFLFFILLATGLLGMSTLVEYSFKNKTIAFFASLFYTLNLFAMTIAWNRFQYSFMFLYAVMPICLYIFIRGLEQKKIIYSLILNVVIVASLMAFASFPLLLLFWFILGMYLFYFFITKRNKKQIIWGIQYYIVNCLVFVIFNLWWIIQFIQTFTASAYVSQQSYSPSDDYITFTALSDSLGRIDFLMRLMHKDFFTWMQVVWGTIYQQPFFILLTFLPLAFIYGSLFTKNKPREYFYYIFLASIGIFFAKGSNEPFGGIFYFLFTHFRLLEAFRNPFEKIGFIIPLAYAPLFGYGLYGFYSNLVKKKKKLSIFLTGVMLFLICGVLVWPMWNGWLFTSNEPPANNVAIGDYVKVPGYYQDANTWLNEQPGDFRTIALPLKGEGLTHTWEYGYNGVDLSSSLFDKPFLAFCTGLEYLCPITNNLPILLVNHPEDFWKTLPPLGVNDVMVRSDVDYRLRAMQSPTDVKKLLTVPNSNFSLQKTFGKLAFYKLTPSLTVPKITGATTAILFNSPQDESFIEAAPYADYKKGDIYITDPQKAGDYKNYTKQIVLKADLFSPEDLDVSKENAEAALPYIRFLPDSRFYQISRIKEAFTRFLAGNDTSREITVESDKRLVETKRLVEKNEFIPAEKTLNEYQSYLTRFSHDPSLVADKLNKMDLLRQKYVLADTIAMVQGQKQNDKSYQQVQSFLTDLLFALDIAPKYPLDLTQYSQYRSSVPQEGDYTLQFETKNWQQFYDTSTIEIIVDDSKKNILPITKAQDTVQSVVHLTAGVHQINIAKPPLKNLVAESDQGTSLEADHKPRNYVFPFTTFDPLGKYDISFDYILDKGSPPVVSIMHDTDVVKQKITQPFLSIEVDLGNYARDWQTVHAIASSDPIAHASNLVFTALPWNDCKLRNTGLLSPRCNNVSFFNDYNRPSQVRIRNIVVTREVTNNLFLTKTKQITKPLVAPKITYTKRNAATYIVTVQDASTPFFLSFLESFHPLWKAYYLDDKGNRTLISEKKHVLINSFANGWFIEKKGNYTLLLEFSPEKYMHWGEIISFGSIILSLGLLLYVRVRKFYANK